MPEERKLVTILFADVTGSTALGEGLDPEDLRALMGRYYDHARRIITTHGGTLEKFIGDAVMAVFGLPRAHSNDAERALAAALALRTAVAEDGVLAGRLVLRIGVNTGEVIAAASDLALGDFLVTGDAVNVAARLEQAADPGEILTGERTADAALAAFTFTASRMIVAKGKSQPLLVFPLAGQRPTRQLGRPPLIGRKADLAQLALLRSRAVADRRPQLVSIVAPAGTGKTRLLEEFLARLDPADGFRVATARCLPYGQPLTYWPLRGLLEDLSDGALTHERVAHMYAVGGNSPDDSKRLAMLVLATLGIESEGDDDRGAERESIFSAWRLLLESLARQAPCIIVFEDLHWASESLLDLVEFLMQPRTQAALLIVATSRPELLDRRPMWGGGRRSFTALALDPLTDEQSRALIARLAKKAPTATIEQIVERAGGNPFFILELIRTLAERGKAGASTGPGALPDTVQETLQEQLDLLSSGERVVLQAAAVAGRIFRPATLRAVLDTPEPQEIAPALDGLLERDLIVPAEGGAYTFRHILIRDVAYGALSRSERIRLHTAVAAWLEAFAADRIDEFVELIAYHYREASLLAKQSAIPPDVAPDTARTVYFLERAGEIASHAGAIIEAGTYLRSAIDFAPASDHRRLHEALGDCLVMGAAALAAYRHALFAWRTDEIPDPLVGTRLLRKIVAILMRWQGSLSERPTAEELITLRADLWRLAEQAGDEYEAWRVRVVDLFWTFWIGEITMEQASAQIAIGLEAAAYFEARGDWAAFNEALDSVQSNAHSIGDYETAISSCHRRLDAPGSDINERSDALAMLVWAQTDAGDYAGAMETARTAMDRRKPGDPAILLGYAANWASLAACLSGHWLELAPFIAIIEEDWEELQRDAGYTAFSRGYFAALHVGLAREDQASVDHAVAALKRIVLIPHSDTWLAALAEAYLHDDPAPLLAFAHHVTSARELTPKGYLLFCIMFLGEHGISFTGTMLDILMTGGVIGYLDAAHGCAEIALALANDDNIRLAAAIDIVEAHGLIPHAARMRVVLAQRTGDRAHLERARPVLKQLGDRQFLRRLEEVAASLA